MEVADMKTNKLAATLVSQLFEQRIVDQSAETAIEIAAKTGESERTVNRRIRDLLAAGSIEQVWKRGTHRPVPAYRVKQ